MFKIMRYCSPIMVAFLPACPLKSPGEFCASAQLPAPPHKGPPNPRLTQTVGFGFNQSGIQCRHWHFEKAPQVTLTTVKTENQ